MMCVIDTPAVTKHDWFLTESILASLRMGVRLWINHVTHSLTYRNIVP